MSQYSDHCNVSAGTDSRSELFVITDIANHTMHLLARLIQQHTDIPLRKFPSEYMDYFSSIHHMAVTSTKMKICLIFFFFSLSKSCNGDEIVKQAMKIILPVILIYHA